MHHLSKYCPTHHALRCVVWGFLCLFGSVVLTAQSDTNRVNRLNELAWELKDDNPDSANIQLRQALTLAQKLRFARGEAQTWNALGVVANIYGHYDEALGYFNKALVIREKLSNALDIAATYNNIGAAYESAADYGRALEYYNRSLRTYETLSDSMRIARACYNISLAHEKLTNYPEALDFVYRSLAITEKASDSASVALAYNAIGNIQLATDRFEDALNSYNQAYSILRAIGDEYELASVLNNLGNAHSELIEQARNANQKDSAKYNFKEAIKYYEEALSLRKTLEDDDGISATLRNLGTLYKDAGDYPRALTNFSQALALGETTDNKERIIEALNGLGDVYRRQNKLTEAQTVTERYLALAKATKNKRYVQFAYKDLSELHAMRGDFKNAYEYRRLFDETRYELLNETRVRDNQRRETLYGDYRKQLEIERQQRQLDTQQTRAAWLIFGTLALGLVVLLLYNRNRIKTKTNRALADKNEQIEIERSRSDALLLNILPADTAAELKATGSSQPRFYPQVTVLFTDFQGFTVMTEKTTPEQLVSALDECYKAFDAITARHNIEKIKTIGDAYMCAAGLPTPNDTHAHDAVRAAIEMTNFITEYRARRIAAGKFPFDMRIGIHTGPVVAGVVGDRKFAYDIWGDTVNTAARMESAGKIGHINISETTYQLVSDSFRCTPRGQIEAKNKGLISMYFVEGATNVG